MDFITSIINSIVNLLGSAATTLLLLLPDSPFHWNLNGASPTADMAFLACPYTWYCHLDVGLCSVSCSVLYNSSGTSLD